MNCQEIQSEYVSSKFKKAKNKKKKKVIICTFAVLFLVFFLVVVFFNNVFNPIIYVYGETEITKLMVVSSNQAINELSSINYNDIITISYSNNNEISLISANSQKINQIANNLALITQQKIDKVSTFGLQVPVGTITGIPFLIGKGSTLHFAINPIGNVKCDFYTSFEQSGINQTNHKIFVAIQTEVSLILPFNIKNIKNSTDYLLSECVIIGKVPNTYLGITSLDELSKSS